MEGPGNPRVFTFCSHLRAQSDLVSSQKAYSMSDRFPPLRPQASAPQKPRSDTRTLPVPAPVDLALLAALVLVAALALI